MRSQLGRTMRREDRATLMEAALRVKSIWDAEELRRTFFRFRNVGVMAWRKFLDDAYKVDVTITKIDSIPDFDQSHVYLSDGRVLIHLDSPEHHDDRVEGCVEVGCRLATTTVLDDNTVNGEELTVYHFVEKN
jgi:hypothetical protein